MIDNKILKHKYLFIFLAFAFSVLFGKIDSQAEEGLKEYYFNTYGLDENTTSYTYHINECKFSTDFNLCFVFAGNYEEVDLSGNVHNASRYYPCMSYKDGVYTFNYSYTKTRLNAKYEVINTTSSSSSQNFYNLDHIKNGGYVQFVCSVWKPLETNIPIFSTFDQAENYLLTGDTTGQINKPLECIFDESIEMPVVHFPNFTKDNIDYTCFITNSTDKYYIEVQGRCHTFDDIELYKDKIYFKTREYTKLKNDLTTWISYKDSIQSKGEHDIADYAKNSFDNLLSLYPVDSRNIFGGTNAVGDFFSGYSAVLNQVKNDLATLRSHFNIIEFYIRFYYIDNNVVHYGKWCHVYNFVTDKDNLIYQSDIGMDDDEKNSLENSSDSLNDNNASNNLSQSAINSLNDDSLWNVIKNLVAGLGDFPELVRSVFSFMPDWLFNILAFGISFIIILRFLGR